MFAVVLGRLPLSQFEALVGQAIDQRVRGLNAADALRTLFRLDSQLYAIQGRKAIEYDHGVHAKHRLIRYHDFFVNRINSHDTVLDIGCGMGALAHDIALKTGARVVAMDKSPASIDQAKHRYGDDLVEFRTGTAPDDLPAGAFDVVILSNVLEHVSDRPGFLRRVVGAAKPSRILVRVPLFDRDWRVPLKKELGVDWRLDGTHETEYTAESFANEMAGAGLQVTHREIRWGEIWAEASPAGRDPDKP